MHSRRGYGAGGDIMGLRSRAGTRNWIYCVDSWCMTNKLIIASFFLATHRGCGDARNPPRHLVWALWRQDRERTSITRSSVAEMRAGRWQTLVTNLKCVIQPHFGYWEPAFYRGSYQHNGPATVPTGRPRRFCGLWQIRRHQVLCLLSQRTFRTCQLTATLVLQ
jgi:hypothetical protein